MYDRAGRESKRLPQEKRMLELGLVIKQPNHWLEGAVGKFNRDLCGSSIRNALRPETVKQEGSADPVIAAHDKFARPMRDGRL